MLHLAGYGDIELIGEGGLGRVYRATRQSTGGVVAIKELRDVAEASPAWHRAVREVEAMLRLKGHPYVVSVEEIAHGPNGPCIVMEFLSGGSLYERVQRRALSVPEVVLVGSQVTQALVAAHAAGVIHRDVKPHNLLVSSFGQIKVADFGIAAVIRESGMRTQTQALTLAYASPEELDGSAEVGPASDVYSLAATLAHLATGRKPSFRDRTLPRLPFDQQSGLLPVGQALRAALEPEPEHRPTMAEMVAVFDGAQTALGPNKLARLALTADLDDTPTVARHAVPPIAAPPAPSAVPPPPPPPPPPAPPPPAPPVAATATTPIVSVATTQPAAPPHGNRRFVAVAVLATFAIVITAIAAMVIFGRSADHTEAQPKTTVRASAGDGTPDPTDGATTASTPTTTVAPATTLPAIAAPATAALATTMPATTPATTPNAPLTPALRTAELNCNVCNLRSQPSIADSSTVLVQLTGAKGSTVEVLSEDGTGWAFVRVNGTAGWLFGVFVFPVPAGFTLGEQSDTVQLVDSTGAPTGVSNPTGNKVLLLSTSGAVYRALLPDGTIAYVSSSVPLR